MSLEKGHWFSAAVEWCENCGARHEGLTQHHVIFRQHVEREGGEIWDPRNGMTLCLDCHERHHNASRRIELRKLPDEAFEFAAELLGYGGAYGYLGRRYAGADPRLSDLAIAADAAEEVAAGAADSSCEASPNRPRGRS